MGDFLSAAAGMGVDVTVGSNHRQVLGRFTPGRSLELGFRSLPDDVAAIAAHAERFPVDAVLGVDEQTTVLAASACEHLGLAHNPATAVLAAHDKFQLRRMLAEAGLPSPAFQALPLDHPDPSPMVEQFPCVLKPRDLSASRGVIRADDVDGFATAWKRVAAIIETADAMPSILVESFIPGREVALEGLLTNGGLEVLALFDKPDPMDGPFFEETIYVTPSRASSEEQRMIAARTAAAARALGLTHGPIHAELRIDDRDAWIIELAARTIGGHCARALTFTGGIGLEELVLRHALALPISSLQRETRAAGVMMIPIPEAGRLQAVDGLSEARAVDGIEQITISIPLGDELVPLPEGDRYLGFIFSRGQTAGAAENALRIAASLLEFTIVGETPGPQAYAPGKPSRIRISLPPGISAGTK